MALKLPLFFVAVWAISTSSAKQRDNIAISRRVVNGHTMYRGEWPFLVSLHYLKPFPFTAQSHMKHVCGGALISQQWVLTAAHCMAFFPNMDNPEDWEVILGEHNQYVKDVGEQTVYIEKVFIHPEWKPHETSLLSNDIALIKLSQPAEMSQYVSIMGLNERKELAKNLECKIGGWGQMLSEPQGWGMYIPLKTGVHIVSKDHCRSEYENLTLKERRQYKIIIDDSVICAGEMKYWLNSDAKVGSDACQGDSGSPLICRTGEEGEFQITGIVSLGEGCGNTKFAGVYTRVSAFKNWIEQVIQDNQ